MKLHMLFAIIAPLIFGQLAVAQENIEAAYRPASAVQHAHAVQIEAFTFDKKGNAVFLGYEHQYLLPCRTEEDLVSQILDIEPVDIKVDPKLEVFTYVTVTDIVNRVVMEGNPSFEMEKKGRKWEQPWLYLDLHAVWDGPIKTGPSDYPLTKKTFGKKVPVSLVFDWVDVRGIVQSDPDELDFVKAFVSPEWNENSIVETWVPTSDRLRLFARSSIGYVPKYVHVVGSFGSKVLPYEDEMELLEELLEFDIELGPLEKFKLWFDFGLKPVV